MSAQSRSTLNSPRPPYEFGDITPETWVENTLAEMSLEEKVGQMILTGVEGDRVTDETCDYVQSLMPGGITFQHGNIIDPEQLRTFVDSLQRCGQNTLVVPMVMTLSHEGEYVNRYYEGATLFPAALALGATGNPAAAYQAAYASGLELAYSGITMVLGPVADVLENYDNDVISQRIYGGDPALVSQYVSQAVAGYSQAGVISVLKHFPGHGSVAEDSHQVLPVDDADIKTLREQYLPPFQAGVIAGAPVIMLSHIAFPKINGGEIPSSLSPEMIQFLRKELDFDGVVLSDSLRMKSVTSNKTISTQEIAVDAAIAGVDMLLLNWDEHAKLAKEFIITAVERNELSEDRIDEAVRRILWMKVSNDLVSFDDLHKSAPDWQANQELAFQLGEQAVALIKDDAGLVPIPKNLSRVMVIGPGNEWELYPALKTALNDSGFNSEFYDFPPPWEGAIKNNQLLEELPARAARSDLVLLFTWQAHLNKLDYQDIWQVELVQRLVASGTPLIIVAIKSPTDLLEFPDVSTFIAMYGTTPGQEQALIDALVGRAALQGVNPLPGLLP